MLYAHSHKSSSTHSALGEFSTAVDLDEPPSIISDQDETTFTISQDHTCQLPSKPSAPPRVEHSHSRSGNFIPTEILMDDSTIKIIQSIPIDEDSTDCSSTICHTCPEHPIPHSHVDLSPNVVIHEHYSNHSHIHYQTPSNAPVAFQPFDPLSGIQYDSISYHLHPFSSRSVRIDPRSQETSMHDISSTKSSPTPRTFISSHNSPLPEILGIPGKTHQNFMHDEDIPTFTSAGLSAHLSSSCFTQSTSFKGVQHSSIEKGNMNGNLHI